MTAAVKTKYPTWADAVAKHHRFVFRFEGHSGDSVGGLLGGGDRAVPLEDANRDEDAGRRRLGRGSHLLRHRDPKTIEIYLPIIPKFSKYVPT